ncbi:hypothetical protein B0A61_09900 [Flavobacterium aquatile LMG 4008 = ATCC 11947]|uniref:Uncharacterized protein n=1 Tax=Flavobacterium aquatile LMG 4008 = ATCC 11947 TaxID=1453498 RepID=A0A095UY40_9FLAO|nr:hypothetical protein LG45_15005 [Flavobacterium aquatile LMG 4008 = ATCC 11947]OXA67044.1 hypothetical protein B0A61_09900 [Flavobacterium aquatile LMG 4008 = ATCC 11947]
MFLFTAFFFRIFIIIADKVFSYFFSLYNNVVSIKIIKYNICFEFFNITFFSQKTTCFLFENNKIDNHLIIELDFLEIKFLSSNSSNE